MSRSLPIVMLTSFLLLSPTAIRAGDGPHQHKGFYLRLAAGVGYGDCGEDSVSISGVGGLSTIAIGGAISENFIINADVWDYVVFNPKVSVSGSSGDLDGSLTVYGIGGGITYYVMPMNLYLSGAVGATKVELEIDGYGDVESDTGFGFNAVIGKEWWVSDNWGLGIAGQVFYSNNDPTSTVAGGLLFSATYN